MANQCGEFLRAAGTGEFVCRLDAKLTNHEVRRIVQRTNKSRQRLVENPHGADGVAADLQRVGDGEVLGNQFAEDHGQSRGDDQRQDQRDGLAGRLTQTHEGEQWRDEFRQDGLGQVTRGQGGDGDAQLSAGQHKAQFAVRAA